MAVYSNGISTREDILQSARELFFRQGYKATTTRQISEHSQANLGLIKYHFNAKATIGLTIYREIQDTLTEWAGRNSTTAAEQLLMGTTAMIRLAFVSREFARFFVELFEEPQAQDQLMEKLETIIQENYTVKRRALNADHVLFLQICLFGATINTVRYAVPRQEQIINSRFFLLDFMKLFVELLNIEDGDNTGIRCMEIMDEYDFSLDANMRLNIEKN